MSELASDRLRLRPVSSDDVEGYLRLFGNAETMAYLGEPWTVEKCREDAAKNEERWAKYGFASWMVDYVNVDGSLDRNIALVGFGEPRSEILVSFGWIVDPLYWRRGVSHESSLLVLNWFFASFNHRVITETMPENIASRSLSEKLGFRHSTNMDAQYVCEITPEQWRKLIK